MTTQVGRTDPEQSRPEDQVENAERNREEVAQQVSKLREEIAEIEDVLNVFSEIARSH